MSISSGLVAYEQQYTVNPIIFTGGIASGMIGSALPLLSFVSGLIGGDDLSSYFNFQPLQGSTLIDQQIGMYPFANQQTAANATIQQPLAISLLMLCPVGATMGYATKPAIMTALRNSFDQHNQSGGLYTILTLSYTYIDCVMLAMTDVSSTMTKQNQTAYKIDFIKPLVSLAAALGAYNNEMGLVASNMPINTSNLTGPGSGFGASGLSSTVPFGAPYGSVTSYSPSLQSTIDTQGIP